MQLSQHIGGMRPGRHLYGQKVCRKKCNALHEVYEEAQPMRHARHLDPTLMKATMLRRIGIIQEAAAIVLARSKACENRYQSVSQLAHKVLVQERKQLFAAEQAYMRNEDAMREHACAAEHSAAQGQATTSQGFATLQAAEQAAGTSQAAAASLLVEDVLAEVARARVFIRAMQQRRLQMSWALSRPDAEQLQRLCRALKQPGMLQAEAEEHAYALVLRQLRDIQKCNKQLSASTIKHAAARTYKDKRRAHLAKSLHASADVQQQQQHLEECKTPTMRTELVGKTTPLAASTAAQQQQDQHLLQAAMAAYDELEQAQTQEIKLYTAANQEETVLVQDFMEKMAWQLTEAEQQLAALLRELQEHVQAAEDLLAAEQQGA